MSGTTAFTNLLKRQKSRLKKVISTDQALFFNMLWSELRKASKYFLKSDESPEEFLLNKTRDTLFFQHVGARAELYKSERDDKLQTHRFNTHRVILEKIASFHGYKSFSACIKRDADDEKGILHTRLIDTLSQGNYSLFELRERR